MVFLGTVVIVTWSLVYRYRRVSSAEQRWQTKWVVFGVALAIAGSFVQLPVDLHSVQPFEMAHAVAHR
jgi:TRAP-type mannitol/chloroaromatic compound transport system permease small subunit